MKQSDKAIPDDVLQAMRSCFDQLDSVIQEQTVERQKLAVPAVLYHYTDGPGLLGVIESGTIRLTDVFGLNDPSELRHGIQIASAALGQESKNGHPAVGFFAKQFRETMDAHIEQMAKIFVACFSRSGDDLGSGVPTPRTALGSRWVSMALHWKNLSSREDRIEIRPSKSTTMTWRLGG